MDEFLTFGQAAADPWKRVGCLCRPILLVIEFCQIQGPRPLYWYPKDGQEEQAHLMEEIAVWLMSSENVHANLCSLYNQQLGIDVLVQYATMLDITARALQRPFAIALLLPTQPIARDIAHFQQVSVKMLLPLLCCNRRFVHSILRCATMMLANGDHCNTQSYYSTSGNAQLIVVVSAKIRSVIQQTRAWNERMAERICNSENSSGLDECCCECGQDEFRKFMVLLSKKQSSCELIDLMELAPCKGRKLKGLLEEAYQNLTGTKGTTGLMFCGALPVIRSTFGANSVLQQDNEEYQGNTPEENIPYTIASGENTLKTLSHRLLRCVYQLLIGERILILASKQRCCTGIDLLNKLNSLRVYKKAEKVRWNFESSNINIIPSDRNQLSGVSCEREQAMHWSEGQLCQDLTVIDLNNYRMRARKYVGLLLNQLSGKRNFPSDNSAIVFVSSVVTDIHQLLLLSRYISPEAVVNQLEMTLSDQLLLYHCLVEFNLAKYMHLDRKKREMLIKTPYKKFNF